MKGTHTRLLDFHEASAEYNRVLKDPIAAAVRREQVGRDETPVREPGEWADEQTGRVIRLARNDVGAGAISAQVGIPANEIVRQLSGIRRCLERWQGLRRRETKHHPGRASSITDKQVAEAIELRLAGRGSWDAIAEAVGTTGGALRYVLSSTGRGQKAMLEMHQRERKA